MTSESRAQRLVDEFEIGASSNLSQGQSIRHGLAAVLRHLIDTESDPGHWGGIPRATFEGLIKAFTAPTLLARAMAGDREAARQFLCEAGFTDADGQLLPQYQAQEPPPPIPTTTPSPPARLSDWVGDVM